jgi:hypothetical protein
VREQVRRAPQQLHFGRRHLLLEHVDDGGEVLQMLGQRLAGRRHVGVMESEEGHVEDAEQVEGDVGLGLGHRHRVAAVHPRPQEGLAAKRVAARPAERMPIAHGETQMVFHAPPGDDAVLVVILVGERVGALRAFEPNRVRQPEESRDGGIHWRISSSSRNMLD